MWFFSLGLYCLGLCAVLDLDDCCLSHVRKVFSYSLFKYLLKSFLFLFFFWDPYNVNVGVHLMLSQGLLDCPHFFHSFFSILPHSDDCHYSVFSSLIHFPASVILVLILYSVLSISVIVLFISVTSLVVLCHCYTCLVSSQSVPPFFFWDLGSSLLWIPFEIDHLSQPSCSWRRKWQPTPVFLPGKSHGPRSLVVYSPRGHKESDMTKRICIVLYCSSRVLSSSFIWDILH